MRVSYPIIIDRLRMFLSGRNTVLDTDRDFDIVQLLPEHEEEINPAHIYFSELNSLAATPFAHRKDLFVICIDDPAVSVNFGNNGCSLILLSPEYGSLRLFNSVLSVFVSMNNWEREMERAISDKLPLGELLKISREFLRQPVFIFDYSLHTLARTQNISGSGKIVNQIIQNEGISNDAIRYILDNNIFTEVRKCHKLSVFRNERLCPATMVIQTMGPNLINVDSVVMFSEGDESAPADIDYMRLFVGMLERYIRINYRASEVHAKSSHSFFCDCIEGRLVSKAGLEKRAMLVGVLSTGAFSLSCYRFNSFSYSAALHLMEEVKAENPFAEIFIYKQEVVLVNNEQRFPNSEADRETVEMRSVEYLKRYNAKVGISCICADLIDLKVSYMQATAAIELGEILAPGKYRYRYRDYFFFLVIRCASEVVDMRFLYTWRLNAVIQNDEKHNTDNLMLLRTYVMTEYSVSRTAEIMHLHRNSVAYRLERIKELMGESLEDPVFRANILLSCFTLQLAEAMEKKNHTENLPRS